VERVLVACPQSRDRREVAAAGLDTRYHVRFEGPDLDSGAGWEAGALVEELAAVPADAVVATKDRSALAAALVAERRGLPGPSPAAVVRCQHKPAAREISRRAVPEATPRFGDVEGPTFVKPAVGRLSQGYEEDYVRGWRELAALAGFHGDIGLLAEERLSGDEVTLEGYVHGGRVTTVGVTDSVMYPGTNSFERFEYPSRHPGERLAELAHVAERLLPALGFDDGFFNVELFVPASGPAKVIEVNARIASQFAPLVRAVHGRSTYEALFEVALGRDPAWRLERPDAVAVSYVLRVFEDAFVEAVPEPEDDVEILVRPGRRLSEQPGANDGASYRLAIVVGAAETREEAVTRCRARARALPFRLRP
jgi:predicted ATP-grasp superfamily ATP-dependent carboligase